MRKFHLFILFLSAFQVHAQELHFSQQTFKQALQTSLKENKPVFVDCFTTWCGPCKKMEITTFKDSAVGKFFNETFINIRLDMEKDTLVANKYKVETFPSYLFLNAQGEVLHRSTGFKNKDEFLLEAKMASDPNYQSLSSSVLAKAYNKEALNMTERMQKLVYAKDNNLPIDTQEVLNVKAQVTVNDFNTGVIYLFIKKFCKRINDDKLVHFLIQNDTQIWESAPAFQTDIHANIVSLFKHELSNLDESKPDYIQTYTQTLTDFKKHCGAYEQEYILFYDLYLNLLVIKNEAKSIELFAKYISYIKNDDDKLSRFGTSFKKLLKTNEERNKVIDIYKSVLDTSNAFRINDELAFFYWEQKDTAQAYKHVELAIKAQKGNTNPNSIVLYPNQDRFYNYTFKLFQKDKAVNVLKAESLKEYSLQVIFKDTIGLSGKHMEVTLAQGSRSFYTEIIYFNTAVGNIVTVRYSNDEFRFLKKNMLTFQFCNKCKEFALNKEEEDRIKIMIDFAGNVRTINNESLGKQK